MNFSAPIITGTGKGKHLGFPTLNLDMDQIPSIEEGVYACFARLGEDRIRLPAVMHFGARPTLGSIASCEIHIIDQIVNIPPQTITVEVADRIRGIQDFGSAEKLSDQLQKDVETARALLCVTC